MSDIINESILRCDLNFIIGSFNIQDFTGDGLYKKRGTPEGVKSVERNIAVIAEIILKEQFDIVAIQEIRDTKALDLLLPYLPGWKGVYAHQDFAEPEFGYIWNSMTFDLYRDYNGDKILPEIITNYSGDITLERNPYYGRFIPKAASKTEIRLINIHLKSQSNLSKTKKEFLIISGDIYNQLNQIRDGSNMDVYTIVLGDYNLKSKYCIECETNAPEQYLTSTIQDNPTTINKEKTGYTENDFDHFGYDRNDSRLSNNEVTAYRVEYIQDVLDRDFEMYRKYISDHVPIKMIINLNSRGVK